jgi:hypothetical protein
MIAHRLRSAFAALAAVMAVSVAHAQGAPQPAPTSVDEAARAAVIAKAADALRNRYIFPETGEKAAAKLEAQLAAGAYKDLSEPRAFATKVTADLYEVAKDKHLRVNVQGGPPTSASGGPPPPPPPRNDGGIVRADKLAGNIGYIEVSGFPPPEAFKPATDRALAALKGVKALIIDVRRNGGGAPPSVAYLVSHFVDPAKPMLLNDFYNRTPGTKDLTTRQSFTEATPISFRGIPVYVLIAPRTFSGGEEFAYDMQSFKLGTLVGETTGGGANPGGVMPIGAPFGIFMPSGRPVNPITKTNWEGVGVIPDIKANVDEALKVALEKLGEKPAATSIDALSKEKVFSPRTTAQPGSEAALREAIAGLTSGNIDYTRLSPGLAEATRQQLPGIQAQFAQLGELKSVTFVEVGPQGLDTYDVAFANGALTWRILLDADGKFLSSGFQRKP